MQKKLVQSSLALAAATALGLGGAFMTSPAIADNGPQRLDVQSDSDVQKALSGIDVSNVNAYGVSDGSLNLSVLEKTDEIKQLEEDFDNVEIVTGVGELKPYAKNDLVGGAGYLVDIPGVGTGACSTGFSGWDDNGKPVVLTAGHCSKNYNEETGEINGDSVVDETELPETAAAVGGEGAKFVPSGLGTIGKWGTHSYGSGELLSDPDQNNWPEPKATDIDIAVINVDESSYNVKNGVTSWKSASTNDLSTDLATDVTKVGAHTDGKVSKSGRTTGVTEGDVWSEYNEKFQFSNIGGYWVHGFGVLSDASDPFSAPGDSGGAVYQGKTAVGVISGGGPLDDDPTKEFGWVADLDYSLKQAGIDFNLEKPDDGGDDENADAQAEGDNANAQADGENANAQADGDNADNDGSSSADGDDANEDAKDDADGGSAADGKDSDGSDNADGKDDKADSDTDGNEKPEAPKVGDQSVVEGGKITGQAEPNAEVKLSWAPADANAGSSQASAQAAPAKGSVTVKTDAEGKFTADAPAEAGDYNYTAVVHANGQDSAATEFVVTVEAEEAPAERKLTVDPKEVTASDFVEKEKGVQITGEGFDEGEKVSLKVASGPENVEGITLEETANADGVVGFSIYGTSKSNPEAYLGKYDVEVTGANDTEDESALTGSFEVVADEDGSGGGDNGDGNDDGNGGGGSDLPRTGAELTGLAAGAGLLLVGGAAVVLTMRRKKNN